MTNSLIVLASLTISLVMCETGSRLFLNPADYLSVKTVSDEILGIRIAPHTAGFDDWGFRNKNIPSAADVVAVGDSHTYGNNATMSESWPYVAGRRAGLTVYNLGLGGYGPNQYFYLLKTHALKLKPRFVLCALYLGDDFENAFLMTYGKPYWSFLRNGNRPGIDANIWGTPDDSSWHQRMRVWLSQNSILYRLVVHGPVLGNVKGAIQVNRASGGHDGFTTSLDVPEAAIHEAFRPIGLLERLDQQSASVQEGMRITFALLRLMDEAARAGGSHLVVVVIPTKETVFAEYLLRDRQIHLGKVIGELITNEQIARTKLFDFLDRAGILYMDTLPALRPHVSHQLYTRSDRDMHPGTTGYRVIGEAVADLLNDQISRGLVR